MNLRSRAVGSPAGARLTRSRRSAKLSASYLVAVRSVRAADRGSCAMSSSSHTARYCGGGLALSLAAKERAIEPRWAADSVCRCTPAVDTADQVVVARLAAGARACQH